MCVEVGPIALVYETHVCVSVCVCDNVVCMFGAFAINWVCLPFSLASYGLRARIYVFSIAAY